VTVRSETLHRDPHAPDSLSTIRNGKWTAVVVLRLRERTLRFSQLQRELGVSQKTLTVTLRGLERDGFISRTSFATIPPRVDYTLTELGNEALALFEAWEDFARRHRAAIAAARQHFDEIAPHPEAFPSILSEFHR
jgi:DNA-binding HxlR family transcriptional regulator